MGSAAGISPKSAASQLFRFVLTTSAVSLLLEIESGGGVLNATEKDEAGIAFFETKIRPVLAEKCYECHSAEAGKSKGGLLLDNREAVQSGGDSGPALESGHPEKSLLLKAIAYENPDLEMPPKERLPAHVVEDFRKWIAMGAPDPREADSSLTSNAPQRQRSVNYEAGRQFWSFQPKASPALPSSVKNGSAAIDHLIGLTLQENSLEPAPLTDKRTLLRRAYFDLTGLPPRPEDIRRFLADPSPKAFEKVVDELLRTRAFGERWGRHWLDVVRFAESSGGGRALIMPEAWRFRDYVIEAFANDKPFDELIREHLAGDLIPAKDPTDRRENLIATGFLSLGPTNYELQDKEMLRMEVVDEQLDTLGRAFMGMTIGCARCHDHPFDPIASEDYYGLAAILRNVRVLEYGNVSSWIHVSLPLEDSRELTPEEKTAQAEFESKIAQLREEFSTKTNDQDRKSVGGKIISLAVQKGSPVYESAMGVEERPGPATGYHIAVRGDVHNLGEAVPRSVLRVTLPPGTPLPDMPENQSGRLELANWIASAENPLTSRVVANRIWAHLFGHGLVRSVDNFGAMGDTPTHPELLDWLATHFVEGGWSVKSLVRTIMLSETYQRQSQPAEDAVETDPENFLLSHQNRRRLEAEALRDSMLLLADSLKPIKGGPTLPKELGSEFDYDFSFRGRSVYLPVFRNNLDDLFEVFDFANPNIVAGQRPVSTIPTQALYLMNSDFVFEQAQRAAAQTEPSVESNPDDEARIRQMFERTLGRPPLPGEARLAYSFIQDFPESSEASEPDAWTALQQALFGSIDFRYLD